MRTVCALNIVHPHPGPQGKGTSHMPTLARGSPNSSLSFRVTWASTISSRRSCSLCAEAHDGAVYSLTCSAGSCANGTSTPARLRAAASSWLNRPASSSCNSRRA